MTDLNSSILITPLSESQLACIDLLKQTLAEAEKGAILAVGIVAAMKGGYAVVMAGSNAAELNLGCDALKKRILDAVENPGRERIVRGRA